MDGTYERGVCVCVPVRACVCMNKADRVMSLEEKDVVQQGKQVETLVTTRKGPRQPKRGWGLLFSRGLVMLLAREGDVEVTRPHGKASGRSASEVLQATLDRTRRYCRA